MDPRTVGIQAVRPSVAPPTLVVFFLLLAVGEDLHPLETALRLPQFAHTSSVWVLLRPSRRPLRPRPPSPLPPFPLLAAAEPLVVVAEPLVAAAAIAVVAAAAAVAAALLPQPLVSALLQPLVAAAALPQPLSPALEFVAKPSSFRFVV